MKKSIHLVFICITLFLYSGCSDSKAYKEYVKKHGTNQRYYCNSDENLRVDLVKNDAKVPTRCSNQVDIKVKESVATGSLSGGVQ